MSPSETEPPSDHERSHHPNSPTLLYESPTFTIVHKPAGMPTTGNKPRTLLNASVFRSLTPHLLACVPRPMSGPAIVSFAPSAPPTPSFVYTFFAIVHCSSETLLDHPDFSITRLRTIPSTTGSLSTLLIRGPTTGHGLRKQLLRLGAPAVGTLADTRPTRCTGRGVYIAATRVEVLAESIDVAVPLPRKFTTLLEREQRFGRARMESARRRVSIDPAGVTRVRFLDWQFRVEGTMKPRESTEVLAITAAGFLRRVGSVGFTPAVLDLGTGCGALLIATILKADVRATGIGVDNCANAVTIATRNARELGLSDVKIVEADFGVLRGLGKFDVVVSNPPYLTKWEIRKDACFFDDEPESALLAGQDGLDAYRAIAGSVGEVLKSDGALVLEVGASCDVKAIRALFLDAGLRFEELVKDFRGFDRCLVLRNAG